MRDEDFEPKPRKNARHPRPEIPRTLPSANLARGWESRGKGTFHGTGIGRGAGVCSELASRTASPPSSRASSSSPVSSSWMERDFSRRALICAISSALAFDSKPEELYESGGWHDQRPSSVQLHLFGRGTVIRIWAFRAEAGRDSLVRPGKEMFEQVECVSEQRKAQTTRIVCKS
ncbi:hypothetical protein NKJ81_26030 [Mesorhizobium sp. M0018]|uniref:hypothetical protein n=1 Tax=Mesorhizobium sp. M0018 TaxID=2956844 RepID=UPI003335A930